MKIKCAFVLTALLLISIYASSVSAQGFEHLTGWQLPDQDTMGRYYKFTIFNDGNTSATIDMFGFYMPDGVMQWVEVANFVLVINESREIEVAQEHRDALRIVVLTTRGNTWPIKMRPTADFTYSRIAENTYSFTDNSSDKDGWIKSWSWNFGDDSISTVQNPTHTFPDSNLYTVTLTVTDDDGLTGTVSKVVGVNDFGVSVDPMSGSVTQGGSASATVTVSQIGSFDNSVSLSASGLPSDASASFSPSSGTPTFSSTMTISTASTTPAGTYTITITGTGGELTHTENYTLTVNSNSGGDGGSAPPKKLYVWVKNPASPGATESWTDWAGIPGAPVSFTVDIGGGTTTLTGTTDSDGYKEWTNVDFLPNQYATASATAPSGYYRYDLDGNAYSSFSRTVHIETGNEYGTVITFSDTGCITGLSSQYSELKFTSVNQIKSTTMTISGSYSEEVDVSYDETDTDGIYHAWSSVSTVPSSPNTYTLNGKCLKWQPPSGNHFYPYVLTTGLVANGDGGFTALFQINVLFKQYAY